MLRKNGKAKISVFLFAFLISVEAQVIPDNRCYLENGASAESFFVSEDLPVGSIIGQLRVHGDPRPNIGSISLRLKEADSPVDIAPGTKNLTLRRRLDKEGVDGPSSVYVNVICDRSRTADPGFVVPVNIRVTDANDNAPKFINAPYVLNISEVTVVGTRVLQGVRAEDADQQGPYSTVRYSVLQGPYADYFVFENDLEGTLVLRKPLDYEQLATFSVGIRAQDQGEPPQFSDTVLQVNVIDADDQNPRFFDDRYTAALPYPPVEGSILTVQPRKIEAYDQDTGINAQIYYSFNSAGPDYRLFTIDRTSGSVTLRRNLASPELDHPATLVVRATQRDNPDRYALTTLTVFKSGPGDREVRFLQRIYHVVVKESTPAGSVVGNIATNHPHEELKYYVSDQHLLEFFTIDPTGELAIRKQLDYETKDAFIFKVFVTDGKTNDSSVVNVTVTNVNDWEPRFRFPQYEFYATGVPGELVGRVEAADGDRGDVVHLSLTGPNATRFNINSAGEIRMTSGAFTEEHPVALLTVVATDSGRPPRQTAVPVRVHFAPRGAGRIAGHSPRPSPGAMVVLVFGVLLVVMTAAAAILATYVCKVKKVKSEVAESPTSFTDKEKSPLSSAGKELDNPVFGGVVETQEKATAQISTASRMKPEITYQARVQQLRPSPKVNKAPDPPHAFARTPSRDKPEPSPGWAFRTPARVKKLSWDDSSQEGLDNADERILHDTAHRLVDNSNLTVYF